MRTDFFTTLKENYLLMIIMNNGSYQFQMEHCKIIQLKRVEKGNKIQDVDWERNFKSQTINVKFDLL